MLASFSPLSKIDIEHVLYMGPEKNALLFTSFIYIYVRLGGYPIGLHYSVNALINLRRA